MEMLMNMTNAQPTSTPLEVKPSSPVKNDAQNAGFGENKQEKDFGEILDQTKQAAENMQKVSEEIAEDSPNPQDAAIAILNIGMLPQIEIKAETDQAAAAKHMTGSAESGTEPLKTMEPSPVFLEKGFGDLIASIQGFDKEANVGKLTQPQLKSAIEGKSADVNGMALNQTELDGTSMKAANAQQLLDLLNGKSLQNAPVIAAAAKPLAEDQKLAKPLADSTVKSGESKAALFSSLTGDADLLDADRTEDTAVKEVAARAANIKLSVEDHVKTAERSPNETRPQKQPVKLSETLFSPEKQADFSEKAENAKPAESSGQFSQFVSNALSAKQQNALTQQSAPVQETPQQLAKYDIPGQIVEHARLIKNTEDTQMVIKLRPEHLGELTLKVTVEKGVVSATFHSDNIQVRAALENSLMQLKQELTNQGIKVDNVGVYAGLGQFLSNGHEQAGREQQSARYKNRKIDLADFDDEVNKVNGGTPTNTATQDGVDYRI